MPNRKIDIIRRLKRKTIYKDNCWIWVGKRNYGYGSVWYNSKTVRIGRLICHLYYNADLLNTKWVACHKDECTDRACWNPEHLYVGTIQQNIADQIRLGRFHYGTANLNSKGNYHWKSDYRNLRGTK